MRQMIENPMLNRPYYPKFLSPAVGAKMCECGTQKAKYWVDGEAHCQDCMMDALDTTEYVRVKRL